MKLPDVWQCELCASKFSKPYEVRNEALILNGADARVYAYTCDDCVKKLLKVIDGAFEENKYAKRNAEFRKVEFV